LTRMLRFFSEGAALCWSLRSWSMPELRGQDHAEILGWLNL
jgi:hypothetical protein